MYRRHSAQFQRVAAQLENMAQKKNLQGAALAWMEGTMNCIEHRKHVRALITAQHGSELLPASADRQPKPPSADRERTG